MLSWIIWSIGHSLTHSLSQLDHRATDTAFHCMKRFPDEKQPPGRMI